MKGEKSQEESWNNINQINSAIKRTEVAPDFHSDLPHVFWEKPVNKGGFQSTEEIWTQQNMFPRAAHPKPEQPHQTLLGPSTQHANLLGTGLCHSIC